MEDPRSTRTSRERRQKRHAQRLGAFAPTASPPLSLLLLSLLLLLSALCGVAVAGAPESVDGAVVAGTAAADGGHGDGETALEKEAEAYCQSLDVNYKTRHDNPCERNKHMSCRVRRVRLLLLSLLLRHLSSPITHQTTIHNNNNNNNNNNNHHHNRRVQLVHRPLLLLRRGAVRRPGGGPGVPPAGEAGFALRDARR